MQKLPLRMSVFAAMALVSALLFPNSSSATSSPTSVSAKRPGDGAPQSTTIDADKGEQKIARRRRRRRTRSTPKPPVAKEPEAKPENQAPITTSRGRPSRVEFDERLIRGQTNKADAIYLFERRSSEMRTLVKKRKHFHREINETLE